MSTNCVCTNTHCSLSYVHHQTVYTCTTCLIKLHAIFRNPNCWYFWRTTSINSISIRRRFIQQNLPIEFLLPAFPCKSPNLDKVTGKLPDAGELYALQHLNNICRQVSFLYQPGCHIRIWFDGRVFGDLIGGRYCKIWKSLEIFSMTMTHISWDSMTNYIDTRINDSKKWRINQYSQTTLSKSYSFFNSSDRSATMLRTPWHNVLVIRLATNFLRFFRKFYFYLLTRRIQLALTDICSISIYDLLPTFR